MKYKILVLFLLLNSLSIYAQKNWKEHVRIAHKEKVVFAMKCSSLSYEAHKDGLLDALVVLGFDVDSALFIEYDKNTSYKQMEEHKEKQLVLLDSIFEASGANYVFLFEDLDYALQPHHYIRFYKSEGGLIDFPRKHMIFAHLSGKLGQHLVKVIGKALK